MADYLETVSFWKEQGIQSKEDLDRVLDNFRILFAYHSGKIENDGVTYHDTREIFENGRVQGYTGDTRALFEQQNQKLCYDYLKSKIIAREPVTVGLVKEVHRIMTSGTYDEHRYVENGERPGEFKKHDYITGKNEVGSASADVEDDMNSLLDEVMAYDGDQVLRVATYFHAAFESAHPFADGNGRVGRSLLNYYLMTHGHPPLIVFDEDKSLYYECLEKFDEQEDIDSLHKFLQYETEKTWDKQIRLAQGEKPERSGLQQLL